jgi:putative DNA methylase
MTVTEDRRLIEDYLPVEAISEEAAREKNIRRGNISTLHLWWARRPITGCRAAVYASLVPVLQFTSKESRDLEHGRMLAKRFITTLCDYSAPAHAIREAEEHILTAHAQRLTKEGGQPISVADIRSGRKPRPRILDMFAGGGAIPLEALRLGCEAVAFELNPLAYVAELCTIVYPQKYGERDIKARGMMGEPNQNGERTWGGLAKEIRYWGNWIIERAKREIGDLYPLVPDPKHKVKGHSTQSDWLITGNNGTIPPGHLMPIAYLWTRTVRCKNPSCGAAIPLARQTWLRQKSGKFIALKPVLRTAEKRVRFKIVTATTQKDLGFDPADMSIGGSVACPFCGTTADLNYVKQEAAQQRMGVQPMAVVANRGAKTEKRYFEASDDDPIAGAVERLQTLLNRLGKKLPDTPMAAWSGIINPPLSGLVRYRDLFNARQLVAIYAIIEALEKCFLEMETAGLDSDHRLAVVTILSVFIDQLADWNCSLCSWISQGEKVGDVLAGPGIGMKWDFVEINPFADTSGTLAPKLDRVCRAIDSLRDVRTAASVLRQDSTQDNDYRAFFDCVITDPLYYSNIPYSHLSDCIYVWLREAIGNYYPEHFAGTTTPKRKEAIASTLRDGELAKEVYESVMTRAFIAARRALKPSGIFVCVYAHRTTAGWTTLINSIRQAGFTIVEAWPVEMEKRGRVIAIDAAALRSNIFLVCRGRAGDEIGNYQTQVVPVLQDIVRERVATLWNMGISGPDLVIACLGAGLRAFTRYARVEHENGETVPAERFLIEVEAVVLDSILDRLSKHAGARGHAHSLAGLDPATRFYVLWRYTYRSVELEAGDAIVFANGTHVELEGHGGLAQGARALIEKKKGRYRLRDYAKRGADASLGLSNEGDTAPLVDVLHRTLWLMEHRPREIGKFLIEAAPNRDQMRLIVQALTGPALKGSELSDISPTGELAVLAKLAANWRSVVDDAVSSAREREDRRVGQRDIFGRG